MQQGASRVVNCLVGKCLKDEQHEPRPSAGTPPPRGRKLLTAARREFAQSGLAGARVDEIAARAGVNKQLVYHYFGDKDAPISPSLNGVYEEIRAKERRLIWRDCRRTGHSKADRELLRPPCRPPRFHRAAQRRKPAAARGTYAAQKSWKPCTRLWSAWFPGFSAKASRAGVFRKGINPVHLYLRSLA